MALFEKISLEKGMYQANNKSLTQVLESLDPSENYIGTFLEGLDAFERQLRRFDIKVSGENSDIVDKFFKCSDSAVLFPEYVSRAVKRGMKEADVLSKVVATVTTLNGMDYRTIISIPEDVNRNVKAINKETYIPQTVVKINESLVKLRKRGRMLVSSYEALRFQRLNLFTVTLKQIGAYIARAQLNDAIDVILNGDGNSNACESITSAVSGKLNYDDFLSLWAKLSPYNLNTILASTNAMEQILGMGQGKYFLEHLDNFNGGNVMTPFGANLLHTAFLGGNCAIGLDKNYALEMVKATDVEVDYNKLIDKQFKRSAITCTTGFSKIFKDASIKLNY